MAARDPKARSENARTAALVNLAKTPNWTEMTAPARRRSPVTFEYWLDKIRAERPDLNSKQQRRMADAAWRAQQRRNAAKAAAAKAARKAENEGTAA